MEVKGSILSPLTTSQSFVELELSISLLPGESGFGKTPVD